MKKYNVIYADPPWKYNDDGTGRMKPRGKGGVGNSAACSKYSVMSTEDIMALPIEDICEKNAVLFLWTTVPFMPEALSVMEAWGFRYKTMLTWRKIMSLGMGYWFRGQCEHLLVGIKGKVKPFRSQKPNFHESRALKHSTKSDYWRKLIDEVVKVSFSEPKKLEMFARSAKDDFFPDHHLQGWDVFGNEVNNSIVLNAPGSPAADTLI